MDASNFITYFQRATADRHRPLPYQTRLATEPWPDILEIPTGLGKTAAIVLAWLYKRRQGNPHTPRRLVYCLPMRVLVEQTHRNVAAWLNALEIAGNAGEPGTTSVHLLMGGEDDLKRASWADYPEQDCILIGTQDMLLSRALMRGYGMSRYQWPIHFALLHNDAMWVFDEVQLMGAALPTSAQLEAFRRTLGLGRSSRSLWASATLHPDWLATVDLKPHLNSSVHHTLSDADRAHPIVQARIDAAKTLAPSPVSLAGDNTDDRKDYVVALAEQVAAAHRPGCNTLVILNNVERAQRLYQALAGKSLLVKPLLLHARYRLAERRQLEHWLTEPPLPEPGRIIVATQAIEAGVDITSAVLFTELAPWPSLVQRFGRCNRYGEYPNAQVFWIDIATADHDNTARPYDVQALDDSRRQLQALYDVGPQSLPPVTGEQDVLPVIRRKDFLDLFNTDPDLSGFDVDISMYIRDRGAPQLQVFWRRFEDAPGEQPMPGRDELCPVSVSQMAEYLKPDKRTAWFWDGLARQWQRLEKHRLRPGLVLLLNCAQGGYDAKLGFVASGKNDVKEIPPQHPVANADIGSDELSTQPRRIGLSDHLSHVSRTALELTEAVAEHRHDAAVVEAALWHDVGKAHDVFQTTLYGGNPRPEDTALLAKSDHSGRHNRPCFRHELASMLSWLANGEKHDTHDLVAYLILAHHGKVRTSLRAMPGEKIPDDDAAPGEVDGPLYARGIRQGDCLPSMTVGDRSLPQTTLQLDLMRMGDGPQGRSWTARAQSLLSEYGPFYLAWLETLVRIADWRASRREQEGEP